jgi:AhpD family alkylhydroperoxidase
MLKQTGHESMTARRLAPLPPERTPELGPLFDSFRRTLGFIPNSALTMQRKPKLLQAFVALQAALWEPDSKVDRGLKRLIAHVAARVAGCRYCQAHTASGALHFGVADAKLAAVWDFRTSPLFSAAERAALEWAVAASAIPNAATDAMFAELRKHWDDEQITEIMGVIAAMGFVTRWNDSLATPIEDEALALGETHLAASGWQAGKHRR